MGERRMFSKSVVESDAFLDMPLTTQALYFHLGMYADDDGFLNNARRIQRITGCADDDLNLLLAKGFIIPFESGICVIRHWRIHNRIRADRYKPTLYSQEKALLEMDAQKGYVLSDIVGIPIDNQTDTIGIPDCNQMGAKWDTQVKLSKVSNIYSAPEDAQESKNEEKQQVNDEKKALEQAREDFEIIYKLYPKKKGKTKAFEYYRGFIGRGRVISSQRYRLTNEQIWSAVNAYVAERRQQGTELEFYQDFSRFMNKTILDYLPEERTE